MKLKYIYTTSVIGLSTNRVRSGLTTLGIVIGVASIMLIMSIGQGAQDLVLNEIAGFGTEMIAIRPGKEPTGPIDIASTLASDSLKNSDVKALRKKSNVPDASAVVPAVFVSGTVSYRGETYRNTQTFGWSAEFMGEIFDVYPKKGAIFTESDIKQRASVTVIGSKVKEELFGNASAVGESIKIKGKNFRVVGVYPPRGQVAFFNVDNLVIIPYSTAQTYLLGINYFHEVIVKASSAGDVPHTVTDIKRTIREQHGIVNPKNDDFFVVTQEGAVNQIKIIISAFTAFLSSVVAIALVVGGIGVMNIMLVSVTERTREIGLRKAVGATNTDILRQFLTEAILLTAIGGVVGIVVGAVLSYVAVIGIGSALGVDWPFAFPVFAAVLSVSVTILVGLVFGLYPARKAARMDPIEALRYE